MRTPLTLALAALCLLGCRTTPDLPEVVQTAMPAGETSGYFKVYDTDTGSRTPDDKAITWAAAYVEKTQDASAYYPVVFFRCLDAEGVTLDVRTQADHQFVNEGAGVKRRIECELPEGTARVEVSLKVEGGPEAGKPQRSAAPSSTTIE